MKLRYLVIPICLLSFILTSCGYITRNYYLIPDNDKKPNGYLLRGSDSIEKPVNDVNQIETEDSIVAVKINNHYESVWAVGIWIFSVIPVFGLPKFGYQHDKEESKELKITVALFSKRNDDIRLNPCRIVLKCKDGQHRPVRYDYSFLKSKAICNCGKNEEEKQMTERSEGFHDVLTINAYFNVVLYPKNNVSVGLPDIYCGNKLIKTPSFNFKRASGTVWGAVL